jgi:hypothetical protein
MNDQFENLVNSKIFREKIEKLTRKTIDEVMSYQQTHMKNIIQETVDTTLSKLGVHVDEANEIRKDFIHARKSREGCEFVKKHSALAFITFTLPTIFYFVFNSISDKLLSLLK